MHKKPELNNININNFNINAILKRGGKEFQSDTSCYK